MSGRGPHNFSGRLTNDEKLKFYIRDEENTMMWRPEDYTGNKFFGTWSKVLLLHKNLLFEQREKYTGVVAGRMQAKRELESVPICFDECINNFSSGLNSTEKNCLRECYLKRTSVRDEINLFATAKYAVQNTKEMKDNSV